MYARMSDACSSAASDCTEAESAGAKAVAQRTSFADVDESKSRLISELKEHIHVISFTQVIQSELARLESETTAAKSEAVHTSDDFIGKAEMTRTAKTRKDLRQLSCFDSCGIGVSLQNSQVVLQTVGLRQGVDTHERTVKASSQLDRVARAPEFLALP